MTPRGDRGEYERPQVEDVDCGEDSIETAPIASGPND